MTFRTEKIGNATLIQGDCREVLPTLGKIDAIVTDPPYGIGMKWKGATRPGRRSGLAWGARSADRQPDWDDIYGDFKPFDPTPWLQFSQVILWGGNNYAGLPVSRGWLVWDKRKDTTPDNHGDAELAWTNLDSVIRVHRQVWRGIVREGEENVANGPKDHPTQKPVALMRWCCEMVEGSILDPYMGSGSTGVACARLGRAFTGIEIEPKYFEVACRRIEDAYKQADLFIPAPAPRPTQQDLLEALL